MQSRDLRVPIEIRESETELLLFVPISQKDRAKSIDGRRWDPERKCWVYPKTPRAYDALVAEFGDDLAKLTVSRPSPVPGPKATIAANEHLEAENRDLRGEMVKIREVLDRLTESKPIDSAPNSDFQARLDARENELNELRRQLQDQATELGSTRAERDSTRAELPRLQDVNETLRADAMRTGAEADPRQQFRETLKKLAAYTAGKSGKFEAIMKSLVLNTSACNDLFNELEKELRGLLGITDKVNLSERVNLAELITQAKDAEILSSDGLHLAHLIRSQRNIVEHRLAERRSYQARTILCLLAAALLWPELERS